MHTVTGTTPNSFILRYNISSIRIVIFRDWKLWLSINDVILSFTQPSNYNQYYFHAPKFIECKYRRDNLQSEEYFDRKRQSNNLHTVNLSINQSEEYCDRKWQPNNLHSVNLLINQWPSAAVIGNQHLEIITPERLYLLLENI